MLLQLSDIISLLKEHRMSFFLRGKFADRFTNIIVDLSENVAGQMEEGFFSRKMSFMLVESFQNILKHGQTADALGLQLQDDGIFCFKVHEKGNFINSINFIQPSDADGLRMSIDYINSLDKASLKSYYMDSLKNNEMSSKGGAGLGFIEMARKSGSKILYRIDDNTGGPIQFHQQISLCRDEIDGEGSNEIEITDRIYRLMREKHLVMLYQGDFSSKIMLPLIEMAEQSVQDNTEELHQSITAAHVVVEMIQNIQRHAIQSLENQSHGYFGIAKSQESIQLIAANHVDKNGMELLTQRLEEINQLDAAGRRELLRNVLKSSLRMDGQPDKGLGLSEIAGATRSPLRYSFTHDHSELYIFTLQVEI
jgi:hypothetical protein